MRERLDVLLIGRGYAASREKAKALIHGGNVYVNGQCVKKAGHMVDEDSLEKLEVRGEGLKFVSRGGLKLEKALRCFAIELSGKVCLDIGASTGGFTDCMLQAGAKKVFAVDVGKEQLADSLKQDARVVSIEQVNFRYMTEEDLGEKPDFAGADVSFISLEKILEPAWRILKDEGEMVCLVKPQFEAGREHVGKRGIVKDEAVHRKVLEKIAAFAEQTGFFVWGIECSPIRGGDGNIEYLMHLKKRSQTGEEDGNGEFREKKMIFLGENLEKRIEKIVKTAHTRDID